MNLSGNILPCLNKYILWVNALSTKVSDNVFPHFPQPITVKSSVRIIDVVHCVKNLHFRVQVMEVLSTQELSWTSRTRILASSDLWVLKNTSAIQSLSLLGVHRTIYNRAEWWQIRGNETFRFAVRQRTQPCCNVFILKVENYSPVISGATWEKKQSAYYERYKEQT